MTVEHWLPMIVCGELVRPQDVSPENRQRLRYETDVEVVMPRLLPEHVKRIIDADSRELHALSISDIVTFIDKAATRWLQPDYELKKQLIRGASAVTGYGERMIELDLEYVSYSARQAELFEVIEMDLGNAYYLDEFIPYKAVYRHAQPRGKVLHVVVGNVQMAGMYTLIRSIVTKNQTIAKLPRRDPFTVLMFALGFLDVDKNHPVSQSLSVGYFDVDDDIGHEMVRASDAVCVWGRRETMDAVRALSRYGTKILEFGPKRSLAVIARQADLETAALRLAHDVSIYDQEACFCPQQVVYEGDELERFIEALAYYLDSFKNRIPRAYTPKDVAAHVNFTHLESVFLDKRVVRRGREWLIIVDGDVRPLDDHPLGRTIYVHPIRDLSEVRQVINADVQTISLYPLSEFPRVAEDFTLLGCTRVVETGLAGKPRLGLAHDGIKPLSELVNWVSVERGTSFSYKYAGASEAELCDYLFGPVRAENENGSESGFANNSMS